MADYVFQGASALSLDAKGRLAVPTRHREVLDRVANGELTLTRHPDGCLLVFPRPAWEETRERLSHLPYTATAYKRIFLGNAMDVKIDSASRVLISPELRAAAGLIKDVMLLGMGSHLELWDATRYAVHEAEALQQGLPQALQDFAF